MVKSARPRAAALAATVGAVGVLAASAVAGPPAGSAPAASVRPASSGAGGRYGSSDPREDGVERQSLALLALDSQDIPPAGSAMSWLADQQCANGGWTEYRPEPATGSCPATAESTTATAAAVQALAALGGHQQAVDEAVNWLRRTQGPDGAWADRPDAPDASSGPDATAAANSALRAARLDPRKVSPSDAPSPGGSSTAGARNAYEGLHAFQLGTTVPSSQRGAFADVRTTGSTPGSTPPPDDAATARAALAIAGGFLPLSGHAENTAPAAYAASYLTTRVRSGGEHLVVEGSNPAEADYASTAYAVLSLAHAGRPADARDAMDWLSSHADDWTATASDPTSALSLLVLAADATNLDPRDLGGTDRLGQLLAQGPEPTATPSAEARPSSSAAPRPASDNAGTLWWIVGLGAVAAIGAPLLRRYSRPRR
jgi:hypothetical protein